MLSSFQLLFHLIAHSEDNKVVKAHHQILTTRHTMLPVGGSHLLLAFLQIPVAQLWTTHGISMCHGIGLNMIGVHDNTDLDRLMD